MRLKICLAVASNLSHLHGAQCGWWWLCVKTWDSEMGWKVLQQVIGSWIWIFAGCFTYHIYMQTHIKFQICMYEGIYNHNAHIFIHPILLPDFIHHNWLISIACMVVPSHFSVMYTGGCGTSPSWTSHTGYVERLGYTWIIKLTLSRLGVFLFQLLLNVLYLVDILWLLKSPSPSRWHFSSSCS